MKELYIAPEATLMCFIASQTMADQKIDWAAMNDESNGEGPEAGVSDSDIEVQI